MHRLQRFVHAWIAGRLMAIFIGVPILFGTGISSAHLIETDKLLNTSVDHQVQQPPRTEMSIYLRPEEHGRTNAGKDNRFFLEIRNWGNTTITNIKLSAEPPEGWVVEFKQTEIDILGPGQSKTIDVNIRPRREFNGETYRSFTITAGANEIRKVQSVSVQAPRGAWVWIGGTIVAVVVAASVIVFVRLNRS